MEGSYFDAGTWWHRRSDGSLLRWDAVGRQWLPAAPETPQRHASEPWQPIAGRAKAVRVVLFVLAGVSALSAISNGLEYQLLSRIDEGAIVSDAQINFNDIRQGILGIVVAGLSIAAVVLFLMWFFCSYKNLERLGASNLRYGAGWSIGAWFVPIFNLWAPKKIANDLWRASDPDMPADAGGRWRNAPIPKQLLGNWWGAWLLSGIAVNATLDQPETLSEAMTDAIVLTVSDLITIAAALLCAAVVARTTSRQEQRAARVATSGSASGPFPAAALSQ